MHHSTRFQSFGLTVCSVNFAEIYPRGPRRFLRTMTSLEQTPAFCHPLADQLFGTANNGHTGEEVNFVRANNFLRLCPRVFCIGRRRRQSNRVRNRHIGRNIDIGGRETLRSYEWKKTFILQERYKRNHRFRLLRILFN